GTGRHYVPGEATTVCPTTDDHHFLPLGRYIVADARPDDPGAKRECSKSALPLLAVQVPSPVLRLLAVLLPRAADPAERGLDLIRGNAVTVVNDLDGADGIGGVTLQLDGHRRRFGIDPVPHELDDGAQRVALMSDAGDVIITGPEYKLLHPGSLRPM